MKQFLKYARRIVEMSMAENRVAGVEGGRLTIRKIFRDKPTKKHIQFSDNKGPLGEVVKIKHYKVPDHYLVTAKFDTDEVLSWLDEEEQK